MPTSAAQNLSTADGHGVLSHQCFLIPQTTNDCTRSEGFWLELHKMVRNKNYAWQISMIFDNLMSQTLILCRKKKTKMFQD